MNAGEMDKRITLLKRAILEGELGNKSESFLPAPDQPEGGTWAKVEWASGVEAFNADANRRSATQRRKFTIRYRPDVEPTWRLAYDGEEYDIVDAGEPPELNSKGGANRGRRRYLVIIAEALEVTSGGGA